MFHSFSRAACLVLVAALSAPAAATIDVRILVDVSGSMKQNDPRNLRAPAIRLLAELLPADARSGIWLFGTEVNALVPAGPVTPDWRRRAREAGGRIHSRALFTDIEAAVRSATADWDGAADPERHVILLTDGVVDVAGQADASTASRQRLTTEVVDRLVAAGAKVHTVALSAAADLDLLATLARRTDGWSEAIADAGTLQRAFLHMFEQAAAPDTVPIDSGSFRIDSSVDEMTLLVFHEREAVTLFDPAGAEFTAAAHGDAVEWIAETGYDLVTVTAPAAGDWRIAGTDDPDNRVLIVTDLALEVGNLPVNILIDESVELGVEMTAQGKTITRTDFLELLTVGAILGEEAAVVLNLGGDDGRFVGTADFGLRPGDYEIIIAVDGGTFRRAHRHRFRVHASPLHLTAELRPGTADLPVAALQLQIEGTLVDPRTMIGAVFVRASDDSVTMHDLPPDPGGEAWRVPLAGPGPHQVEGRFVLGTAGGRALSVTTPTVVLETPGPDPQAIAVTPPEPAAAVPARFSWSRFALVLGGGNAVVAAVLALTWLAWRRRPQAEEAIPA